MTVKASDALRKILNDRLVPERDNANMMSNPDDTQARIDAVVDGERFRVTVQRLP